MSKWPIPLNHFVDQRAIVVQRFVGRKWYETGKHIWKKSWVAPLPAISHIDRFLGYWRKVKDSHCSCISVLGFVDRLTCMIKLRKILFIHSLALSHSFSPFYNLSWCIELIKLTSGLVACQDETCMKIFVKLFILDIAFLASEFTVFE